MCRQETTVRFWGWKRCEGQESSHRVQACLCRPGPSPALQPASSLGRWGGSGAGTPGHMMQTASGDARSPCITLRCFSCIPLWLTSQAVVRTCLHTRVPKAETFLQNLQLQRILRGLRHRTVPPQLTATGSKMMAPEFTHVRSGQ